MKQQPYGNRILGELLSTSEITASGIVLGEARAPQSVRLKVLAIGPDVKFTAVDDTVIVSAFAPTEARVSQVDKTVIFSEDDILSRVLTKTK